MHAEIPPLSESAKSIQLGRYRHYKGGEYEVVCIGRLEGDETKEMVVYKSVEHGDVWIRPVAEFLQQITTDRYNGPRFIALSDVAGV